MPSTHASTHLQMFTTFKEQKKKADLMLFDINPVTAKYQTGDKPEAEGKYSEHLFIGLVFNMIQTYWGVFLHLLSDHGEKNNNQHSAVLNFCTFPSTSKCYTS